MSHYCQASCKGIRFPAAPLEESRQKHGKDRLIYLGNVGFSGEQVRESLRVLLLGVAELLPAGGVCRHTPLNTSRVILKKARCTASSPSAFALTGLVSAYLCGVTGNDPLTLLVISALLALVALLACYVPAPRATRIDPLIALRAE
jgi:hypothetical protein